MGKTTKLILTLIIAIVVIGGGLLLFAPNKSKAPGNTVKSSTDTTTNEKIAATITYDGDSFSSSTDTVKAGDTVKVVNNSDDDLEFDSAPHPVHTDNPELNAGGIGPGMSKTFTLNKKGTWGFHNHVNSSQRGSIIVQ